MIVILKKSAEKQQVELFDSWLHSMGLETHKSIGANHTDRKSRRVGKECAAMCRSRWSP